MSILTSFKKLVDPETARMDEAGKRVEQERPRKEADGDGPDYRCKVCGLVDKAPEYCKSCLAPTMRPVER